jgi:HAD superfamily hydrolase (TIGR01459 family)
MSYLEISGLRDLAPRYRCLFVDAYGVLYDGAASFPGAPEALLRAREAGLKVCIVTNSASRVDIVAARLAERAGVSPDHYDALVTSGEISWRYLEERQLPPDAPLFVITEAGGPAWIAEMAHRRVDDVRQAQALLAVGIPYHTEAAFYASDFAQILQQAARLDLPMIVADSDETYPWRGIIRLGAGWIARVYAAMGGRLVEFGKPHRPIYEEAARQLDGPARHEILGIGDNLLTDIAGAAGFDIDSLLVLEGGVHGGQSPAELRGRVGAAPTYIAPRLAW